MMALKASSPFRNAVVSGSQLKKDKQSRNGPLGGTAEKYIDGLVIVEGTKSQRLGFVRPFAEGPV